MGWRLAEALDAVHASGIVHGGINPHTIWVADSTGRELPMTYLTGFGSARALAREVSIQGRSPASDDLAYMDPDQLRRGHGSPEADRYALACAVYHLITGVPPFQRGSAGGLGGAPLSNTVDSPAAVRHGLPLALDPVFARALAHETSQRYPSAHALMTAVERALRERSAGAARGSAGWSGDGSRTAERDVVAALASEGDAITAADDEEEETTDRLDLIDSGAATVDGVAPTPAVGDDWDSESTADDEPEPDAAVEVAPEPEPDTAAETEAEPEPDTAVEPPRTAEIGWWSVADDARQSSVDADDDGMPLHDAFDRNPLGAGGVEARRAARERGGAGVPRVTLPPRPSVALEPPASRVTAVLDVLKARRGVVLLAFSTLATVVVVTMALAIRYSGERAESDVAAGGQQAAQQERAEDPGIVHPLWTTPIESQPVRSIAVARDALVAATDTSLAAVDPVGGERVWRNQTDGDVNDIAVVRNVVITATTEGLAGYDVASGRVRWALPRAEADPGALVAGAREAYAATRDDLGGILLSAITPAGVVEPVGTVSTAKAVSGGGGRLALAFDPGGKAGDPTLYVLTRAALHAFDVETRTVRWRAPVDKDATARLRARPWVDSLAAAGGAAFVADRDGGICRYAGGSGEQVWTECQDLPVSVTATPDVQIRGGRVIVTSGEAMAAYNFTNGQPLWARTPEGQTHGAVASGRDAVFVAYSDGGLDALDNASGRQQWRAPEVGDVTLLVAGQEGVFVGGTDGNISLLRHPAAASSDAQ
jgi:outer membrane protein assembly factor BamB